MIFKVGDIVAPRETITDALTFRQNQRLRIHAIVEYKNVERTRIQKTSSPDALLYFNERDVELRNGVYAHRFKKIGSLATECKIMEELQCQKRK